MTTDVNLNRYRQLIRTAMFLRREYQGRNANILFEARESGRTVYVFDTDIVKTRCAPWLTGPRDDSGGNGYGEVFDEPLAEPGDDEHVRQIQRRRDAENTAMSLADYVFRLAAPPKGAGVFQLPSHSAETNTVYRAVRRSLERFERADINRYNARRRFELARLVVLLKQRANEGATFEQALPRIDKILDLFLYGDKVPESDRSRVIKEWDNYYELESQLGGVYSIEDAAHFFRSEPKVSKAFEVTREGKRSPDEQKTFGRLLKHWRDNLSSHKHENVDADAQALAHLFLINSRLKTTNTRCVFVTGDRTLVRQAYGPVPFKLVPPEDVELANSFSLHFVQHLWGFLSDALVDPANEDIYSGLLAKWSGPRHLPEEKLEQLIATEENDPTLKSDAPAGVEDILRQWEVLTNKSVRQYGLKRVNANDALRHVIWERVLKSAPMDWLTLLPLLKEDVDRVRDRTVLAMSDLGIDTIIKATKLGKRNPPELIFDSLQNTNQIFRRLSSMPGYQTAEEFELDFGRISEDCHDSSYDGDDRQESHLKFLVLAAAFASADKWMIALSHARRAINIIERSKSTIPVRHKGENGGPKSHMSGREAYFLAATAQRLLATGENELFQSSKYLNLAREALIQDRSKATAKGIGSYRFLNEDVALLLSRYYLARQDNPADLQDRLVEALFRNVEPLLDEFITWQSPRGDAISNVTAVSVATNLIQTYVISEFRKARNLPEQMFCPVQRSDVLRAVVLIEERSTWRTNASGAVIATRLIATYAWMGFLLAQDLDTKQVSSALDAVRALLDDPSVGYVTAYDAWRYQALRDFVDRREDVRFRG